MARTLFNDNVGGNKRIFLLEPHISVYSSRLTVEQKVTIQMHQTVPKTKSHVRSPLYRGSYRHDSGVRDSRHPKGARSMPGKNKELEEDPAGNAPPEFIAERNRFLEWVYNNEELQAHAASRAKKKKYPRGIIEEARQKMLEGALRRYGKGENKLQKLWRNVEKQYVATQKNPKEELTIYLKTTFNNKCIDVLKEIGFIQNEDGEWIIREEPTDQPVGDGNVISYFDGVENSELGQRIRFCIREHCRSKHLATYIGIINFWEVGIREPQAICASISGLTPSSYNDLQGALIDFLKKHRDCWFNDEDGEDQS